MSSPAACCCSRGACRGAAGGFGVGCRACSALRGGVHLHRGGSGRGSGLGRGAGSGGPGTGIGAGSRLGAGTLRGAGAYGSAYGHVGCRIPIGAKAADMSEALYKQNFGSLGELT